MNNKETINIEKRVFNYLLKYCDISLEDAEEHYKRIDEIMPQIKIGDKLYKYKTTDLNNFVNTYYELKVIKVIDKKEGVLLVDGYNRYQQKVEKHIEYINYLYIEKELSKKHILIESD